ncbi:hypothetical protein [Methylobacterium marchantiae]|uniref:Uncharacterized protein n=1 Tax=Methylobacterium marchantiae TaxID=600331 RepID=A0ABW3WWP8_9HYPH|nr:hypothetical protein AIGOOFII_0548 [Methylobacterium marchantiae]
MPQPHYFVRRSRMGRFNFTLIGAYGRITGVVVIPTENKSREEIEAAAHQKIRALADELVTVMGKAASA